MPCPHVAEFGECDRFLPVDSQALSFHLLCGASDPPAVEAAKYPLRFLTGLFQQTPQMELCPSSWRVKRRRRPRPRIELLELLTTCANTTAHPTDSDAANKELSNRIELDQPKLPTTRN